MDLVISPALCEVTVNPASPQVARGWIPGAGGAAKTLENSRLESPCRAGIIESIE